MFHLPHCRWALHREQKSFTESYEHSPDFYIFQIITHNLLLANLLQEWMSALTEAIWGYLFFFIYLFFIIYFFNQFANAVCYVIMSENTFTQMESPLLQDQSGVPAERSYKTRHPHLS